MRPDNVESSFKQLSSTPQGRRMLEQEILVVSATELISQLLEEKSVSRAELARRIGKSKAFVTQILRGRHNMTLRTLADLAWAFEARVSLRALRGRRQRPARATRNQAYRRAAQATRAAWRAKHPAADPTAVATG